MISTDQVQATVGFAGIFDRILWRDDIVGPAVYDFDVSGCRRILLRLERGDVKRRGDQKQGMRLNRSRGYQRYIAPHTGTHQDEWPGFLLQKSQQAFNPQVRIHAVAIIDTVDFTSFRRGDFRETFDLESPGTTFLAVRKKSFMLPLQ